MSKLSNKKCSIVLTKRQIQCAEYLLRGMTARETANALGLSRRTVEYYLGNIKSKLACNNKTTLILKLSSVLGLK